MVNLQIATRNAHPEDQAQIANLMYFEPHVHRHLDWRGPLEWLGVPEYWVLEQFGSLVAALACPPDPEGVAWLRLFAHSSTVPMTDAWGMLWETAKPVLQGRGLTVAAISVSEWFRKLISSNGFTEHQEIVVLEQNTVPFIRRPIPADLRIRPMTINDLPTVTEVDAAAFAPLWRNSEDALRSAFSQSGFATVAQLGDRIVGYQVTTKNAFGAHLARLAVSPEQQGNSLGYLLVQDLLDQTRRAGLYRLTVNTQNDNNKSLALYQKIGFALTGERYTVFTYRP